MVTRNGYTRTAKNEAENYKNPLIVLTTIEDLGREIVKILTNLKTVQRSIYTNIEITNAELIHINRQDTNIVITGEEVKAIIK